MLNAWDAYLGARVLDRNAPDILASVRIYFNIRRLHQNERRSEGLLRAHREVNDLSTLVFFLGTRPVALEVESINVTMFQIFQ